LRSIIRLATSSIRVSSVTETTFVDMMSRAKVPAIRRMSFSMRLGVCK